MATVATKRKVGRAGALMAALGMLVSFNGEASEWPSAELFEDEGAASYGFPTRFTSSSFTMSTSVLCLTDGPFTDIQAVEPIDDDGGLRVSDFVVWDMRNDDALASIYPNKKIAETPAAGMSRRVERACGDDRFQRHAWLMVELEPVTDGSGAVSTDGFVVTYRSGNKSKQIELMVGLTVCWDPLDETRPCPPDL